MVAFEMFVQEGCVPEDLRPGIAAAVEGICLDVLGAGDVSIEWTVVARGYGFRGGKPSTTSLVRGRIPDGCDRGTRARFLMGIADAWRRITGAAEDEVIVSGRDWSWVG
ncbi:MAG: hypothetical protein OXH99_01015 [Bryobacterales bacterium]|nr:hypothetical protein [Bryobacterales bacterium]